MEVLITIDNQNIEILKLHLDRWSAFGENIEGADYRACENYGPLYGKK